MKAVCLHLLILVVLGSADANERANQGTNDGRNLCHDLAIAPAENLVEANISSGASRDTDKHQPLEDVVYFVSQFQL